MRFFWLSMVALTLSFSACGKDAALTKQVCGKSLAVVGERRWVDAGVIPTSIDVQIDCTQQDPNAPTAGTTGALCGSSNVVLHRADQTSLMVAVGGDSQYFSQGYKASPSATQTYAVLQESSAVGVAGLATDEYLVVDVRIPQVQLPKPGALSLAPDALSSNPNAGQIGLVFARTDPNNAATFEVTSGAINITAISFSPAGHIAFSALGLPVAMTESNPNVLICPDQHLHVVDSGLVSAGTTPTSDPNACTAALAEAVAGGYGEANCVSATGTFTCSDANTTTTSTQCCAADLRWKSCAAQSPTPVCVAAAIAAPGTQNFFVDCKVSNQLEFTCPAADNPASVTVDTSCCTQDARWSACNP